MEMVRNDEHEGYATPVLLIEIQPVHMSPQESVRHERNV